MPYDIKKEGNKYVVFNKDTGESKGSHPTRPLAVKQMRLLYMVESGKKPTKNKK